MEEFSIRGKCRVNTNKDADVFVGIKCEDNDISINFPIGYEISKDDKGLRKDILLLLNTIKTTTAKRNSEIKEGHKAYNETAFPIQAYMAVIYDFSSRGYYKEREVVYSVAKRGKTDWNRTVKTQKAYIQDKSAYYLDFVTKKNTVNNDQMITLIHEYCVYESFSKVGWLFTGGIPQKPKLKYNERLFRTVLKAKIANTFNDRNKSLFLHMLAIIDYQGSADSKHNYRYGTYSFEYVWEAMIDKVYGITDKKEYFPKTWWNIGAGMYPNAPLRPDTVMVCHKDVYVLDAKYYKYGVTGRAADLPDSTSIHKQITYGEYIAGQDRFKEKYGQDFPVYNAFLMPFNSYIEGCKPADHIVRVGEALSDWKGNNKPYDKPYERVQGILIDTKYLMKISTRQNEEEILKLADKIKQFGNRI